MSQTPTRNRPQPDGDPSAAPATAAPATGALQAVQRSGAAALDGARTAGRGTIARHRPRRTFRGARAVPALLAWYALLRGVDRMEGVLVPAIQRLGGRLGRLIGRGEARAVPAVTSSAGGVARGAGRGQAGLAAAASAGARAAARGLAAGATAAAVGGRSAARGLQAAVSETVGGWRSLGRGWRRAVAAGAAGGRGIARGVQSAETRALGGGTALLDPPGGPRWDGDRDQPLATLFDEGPEDPEAARPVPTASNAAVASLRGRRIGRDDVRRLARSVVGNTGGLLVTGIVAVVLTALLAQTVVPTAAEQTTSAVDAELVLPDDVALDELAEPSTIYAGDGTPLATLDQEIDRNVVPIEAIPPFVQQAVISAEDRKFYEHDGYDAEGIGRALLANVEAGELTQGGSTITQQLAKSIVGAERSLERKVEELVYAVALEERFEKDELLEQYLNQVFFGRNAYGVDAAAQKYFNVPQDQLRLEQAALLAAMIRSPNTANPDERPELAQRRRDAVLQAMVDEGYVGQAEADAAKAAPLGVAPVARDAVQLPFIVDAVREEFLTSPEFAAFGATRQEREEALFFGGLEIHSSLDRRLQDVATQVLQRSFTGDPAEVTGALATVEPATGRILAASGALRYEDENFNLATQGRRQAGSTFKPFVYAAALEAGLPESTPLTGRSPGYFEDTPGWRRSDGGVTNYGGRSYGTLNMRSALTNSVNTATVQLAKTIGITRVTDLVARMGVDVQAATDGEIVDAIALGGLNIGVTPLEMASAYSVFANNGIHVRPHLIDRIERQGTEVYRGQPPGIQVLESQVNATMVSMMQDVVNQGTGTRARIRGWEVAGKTGTTNNNRDAWFVGYTPTLATAMWYGFESGQQSTGQTGGGRPAQIWNEYMVQALEGVEPVPFPEVEQGSGRPEPGIPTTVPDLRRLPSSDALRLLIDAQLIADIRNVSSEARAGTVVSQRPEPGTPLLSGETVRVNVSSGQAPAPSPRPRPAVPAPRAGTTGGGTTGGDTTGATTGQEPGDTQQPAAGTAGGAAGGQPAVPPPAEQPQVGPAAPRPGLPGRQELDDQG